MRRLVAVLIGIGLAMTGWSAPVDEVTFGPYFLGYETEPSMDYGGRTVTSVHQGVCDLGASLFRRHSWIAPAFEVPFGLLLSTVQHEINGHGSRAREYDLRPSYGFGFDFSAYTTIDRDPETNEQMAYLAAGGTESDTVLARRILIDLCRPGGAPASAIPLMLVAKLDISLYSFITVRPEEGDETEGEGSTGEDAEEDPSSFVDQYEEGNDIAIYLVTRQGLRNGVDPVDIWERDYTPDFDDPMLEKNWDDVQQMALWNMLDPMVWYSLVRYVNDHVMHGKRYAGAPALFLTEALAVTAGTRGAIGPQSVTRVLDLYLLTDIGIVSVYGRDLNSSKDTTFGFGGGIYRLKLGPHCRLSVAADYWENPDSDEELYDGTGWNASAELDATFGTRFGASAKLGGKSDGFFIGTPTDSGVYFGGGVSVGF
jgi:hypothetical protein